ncbi:MULTISPECIES: hypothetical protein [Actinoplanes]|uniref:hypothetical protein n=1 Tax=Actinoplanes TaxID=1865 RepID=UPI0005F2EDD4|nr:MULTISPECIES: hypothetical protein [Actinoplanes]GLY08378.1 hypothetical protein Acsp01_87570 [Actinoplanes sp. NBRC 101535]
MTKMFTVAEMVLRDLARRRTVLGLLFLLPLGFYAARHDQTGQAIRFASLGLGWGASTAGLFSSNSAKSVEPRLRLVGYSWVTLLVGRLVALLLISWTIAAAYFLLIYFDQDIQRPGALAVMLALTAAIAVPLGMLIGALVPRDLEGTLVLIAFVGVQMAIDPAKDSAKYLPFWSSREIGTYIVDPVGDDYLQRGLQHGLGVTAGLILFAAVVTAIRLRRRKHIHVLTQPVPAGTR